MTTNLQISPAIEAAIIHGDLSKLTPEQRVSYYNALCASVGLNPLTQPFAYLRLQGKEVLYAKKDATDQLRKLHGVSILKLETQITEGICVVTATARDKVGKDDSEIGAVNVKGVVGEALANAMMKASTKAKRRVTLSICGLGILDESEVESISDAKPLPTAGAVVTGKSSQPEPKQAAKEIEAPKARTRKVVGVEIMEAAAELGISKKEVEEWAKCDFKKASTDLTIPEMEQLLEAIKVEIISREASKGETA